MGILGVAEGVRQHGAGRIVDRGEQYEAWPACFEPVVIAAVDLHQQAGHAFPVARWGDVSGGSGFPQRAGGGRSSGVTAAGLRAQRGAHSGAGS